MSIEKTLENFNELLAKYQSLHYACSTIHWDSATGAPRKGAQERAKTLGILSGEIHSILNSDEMVECIKELSANKDELDDITKSSLRLIKKEYDYTSKIPKDEYAKYCEAASISSRVWEEAKEQSNFELFRPHLEKVINFQKKFVEYRGFDKYKYNVLLDDFEPGMTIEILDEFFDTLRKRIVPLVKKITSSKKKINSAFAKEKFDIDKQKEYSEYLLHVIGFDFDAGMFRESMHPFTLNLNPYDVRITSHFYEDMLLSSVYSTIHEGGHALYEQDIDKKLSGTIAGTGVSMGIHESQSRTYENNLGRDYHFCKLIFPKLKEMFPEKLSDVSLQDFYEAVNESQPSLIRTEADELTYSLHIMVRYEIEKMIMNDEVEIKDLPQIWNEKMQEYLGLTPANDAEGVLQDVHWSDGSLGYFPSYALGSAYAAQFIHAMKKDLDLDSVLENGEMNKIQEWLTDKIHKYGSTKLPNDILKDVTGEGLNPNYYIEYLEDKYSKIYELN